jgi:hypothetical protein
MSQTDMNVANGPGASVRSDINDHLEALATNNSGSTEPSTTFGNMWWFDTANNILKQRNAANNAWVNVALKDSNGWTPYFQGTQITAMAIKAFASQAQAEAGSNNDSVMTPLRVAQAIAALVAGPNFATHSFTRNLTTASGDVTISGLSFAPKAALFVSFVDNAAILSIGFAVNGGTSKCMAKPGSITGYSEAGANRCIELLVDGANYQHANVTAWNSGGLTLTFTKVLSPTGTGVVLVLLLG